METNQPKAGPDKSLMDRIASDPEIINRSLADTGEAPVVVKPVLGAAVVSAPSPAVPESEHMGNSQAAPIFNLLKPNGLGEPEVAPVAATPQPAVHRRKRWPLVVAVLVILAGLGGGAYLWASKNQPAKPLAQATPTPTPKPTATPTPTPTVTPVPTPSPVPADVTAPAAAPTADHPQAVTVTSASGLWLRSTPDSSNKSNIIGWLPNHAQVSVDQVGDFWWHGTYNGHAGYFAVNYTH